MYHKILNPGNSNLYNIHSKIGKQILKNYLTFLLGSGLSKEVEVRTIRNNQKGGGMFWDKQRRIWIGKNRSGNADANFFNFLGIMNKINYFNLWRYPNTEGGIMNSPWYTNRNKYRILDMLKEIINVRTIALQNYYEMGARDKYTDYHSADEGHTQVLSYVKQLRNLIMKAGKVNFNRTDFDIEDTEGYAGIASEVSNLYNPSIRDRFDVRGMTDAFSAISLENGERKVDVFGTPLKQ